MKPCISNDRIALYYAEPKDKRLVFDISMAPGIKEILFCGKCKAESWEVFRLDEDEYYTGIPGKDNYLLIVYKDEVIGWISHSYNDALIENMELDISLKSLDYTGKGLGSEAMMLLMDYLYDEYNISTFIIRPGNHNKRAIRAYEKCGFKISNEFRAVDYYGENCDEWGDGDYGKDATINMIRKL